MRRGVVREGRRRTKRKWEEGVPLRTEWRWECGIMWRKKLIFFVFLSLAVPFFFSFLFSSFHSFFPSFCPSFFPFLHVFISSSLLHLLFHPSFDSWTCQPMYPSSSLLPHSPFSGHPYRVSLFNKLGRGGEYIVILCLGLRTSNLGKLVDGCLYILFI